MELSPYLFLLGLALSQNDFANPPQETCDTLSGLLRFEIDPPLPEEKYLTANFECRHLNESCGDSLSPQDRVPILEELGIHLKKPLTQCHRQKG
jgi:hypothetical protein